MAGALCDRLQLPGHARPRWSHPGVCPLNPCPCSCSLPAFHNSPLWQSVALSTLLSNQHNIARLIHLRLVFWLCIAAQFAVLLLPL